MEGVARRCPPLIFTTRENRKRKTLKMKKVYIYVCMTAFLFGTMEVALKLAGSDLDAFQLTFLRFIIGGLLLLPPALAELRKNEIILKFKDWAWLLLMGTVCVPVSMVLFQLGVVHASASTAAVIFCINPLFTMILARLFGGEPGSKNKLIAFFVGLLGIFFMIRPWDVQVGNTWTGMMFSVTGALAFSIYTVMGKRTIGKFGNMVQTGFSLILGSAVLLIIILAADKPVIKNVVENLPVVLYVSVFVTGLGYWAFFQAIKYSDATTGSVAFFIKPAIAPVFAVIILGDHILWNTLVGIGLILIASYINLRESRKGSLRYGHL